MLIHLRSIDGKPLITIDPEGEPLPHIETLPWNDRAIRLSWPQSGERGGYPGEPRMTAPAPQPPGDAAAVPAAAKPGGRIGRYAAMTATFAVTLIAGMVIASVFRSGPDNGPGGGLGAQVTAFSPDTGLRSSSGTIPRLTAPPRPPLVIPPARITGPDDGPFGTDNPAATPPPPPPVPSAPPRQIPPPPDPGALFGLHS